MNRNSRERRIFQEEMIVHYKVVFNFLYQQTRNEVDASDLTQDTFERAYRKIDHYQPGTNARAWLCRIAQNLFINKYRKTKRRGEKELDERQAFNQIDESCSMAGFSDLRVSGALDQDFSDPIFRAMVLLSDEQRAIIIMSDLYDFAEKEIAEVLELNLNTVKGKIRRARLSLIRQLQGYAERTYGIVNTRNLG